jgi:hypothetical protein
LKIISEPAIKFSRSGSSQSDQQTWRILIDLFQVLRLEGPDEADGFLQGAEQVLRGLVAPHLRKRHLRLLALSQRTTAIIIGVLTLVPL